ncbi:probable serine/threonine-protein kinase DDB_G0282963 isoform X1 [Drosophila subobscura]|uniref:probable serine/threonine-protein kinase DDB_G0282963 isoform X1 n=2 Tax=Drosophila subobscura TaxID=7241 RepID=UPI00155B2CF4|nr:probable serine/threonine-protein kinase DDB_G0282963 isoform X1 [Drosophila subobscura]
MAPFKLKFRMGSSRSTSQEHDPDPQVNEALLGNQQQQQQQHQKQQQQQQQVSEVEASSSSSLDLADCNGLGPMSSERKLLLPQNKAALSLNSNSMRYQSRTPCINESLTDDTDAVDILPTTPPPSYEHVLEENTRLSQHQRKVSLDSAVTPNQNSRRSSANSSRHSAAQLGAALEQLEGRISSGGRSSSSNSSTGSSLCNDPDCQQNLNQNYSHCGGSSNNNNNNNEGEQLAEGVYELEQHSDTEFDCPEEDLNTISVNEFLLESEMAASSSRCQDKLYGDGDADENETEQGQCTDDQCAQCTEEREAAGEEATHDGDEASTSSQAAAFYDPLLNRGNYGHYNEGGNSHSRPVSSNSQVCQEACCSGSASGSLASRSRSGGRRQQQQQQQQQSNCQTNLLTPEMMSNKTSKEIYKDLAKQWGITCKMSESCRCMDCQSNYFDCDYDDNEHHKTDGGLGAGTPMFISEVMHGSGCTIL